MTKLWWKAGNAKPLMAIDNESGWSVFGNTYSIFNKKFQTITSFDFELTEEQINTVSQLADENLVYPGHYLSWQHFTNTHGIDSKDKENNG